MTASVIQLSSFRKQPSLPEPPSPEEIQLDRLRQIDGIVEDIIPDVVASLIDCGFDVTGDDYVKDIALMVESVRATMFRFDGRAHGLHTVSNKIKVDGIPVQRTLAANTA